MRFGFTLLLALSAIFSNSCRTSNSGSDSSLNEGLTDEEKIQLSYIEKVFARDIKEKALSYFNEYDLSGLKAVQMGACWLTGGLTLQKADGLAVNMGIDPVKYFPVISKFVGTPLNVSYIFFQQEDSSLVGQAYLTPQLQVAPGTNGSTSASLGIGYTFGCQGNPANYHGYFSNASFSGYEIKFGIDGLALFEKGMKPRNSGSYDWASTLKNYYFKGNNLLRQTHTYSTHITKGKTESDEYSFTKKQQDDAIAYAKTLNFKDLDGTKISLGSILSDARANEHKKIEAFQQLETLKNAESITDRLEKRPEGEPKTVAWAHAFDVHSTLIEMIDELQDELTRLNSIYMPAFVYAKSSPPSTPTKVDLRAQYLNALRQKHGASIAKWAEDVLSGYEKRYIGLQRMHIIAWEWLHQFRKNGEFDIAMKVGGIQTGSVFTGCNAVNLDSSTLARMAAVAGKTASIASLAVRPIALAKTVVTTPIKMIKTVSDFKGLVSSAGKSMDKTYFGISHVYPIPGTRLTWKANNISKGIGYVRKVFDAACPDLPAMPEF